MKTNFRLWSTFFLAIWFLYFSISCSNIDKVPSKTLQLQWKKSTPLPEPRAGHAAGILDEKFIIAGGTYWEGEKGNWTQKLFSSSTHAFDPKNQTWERLPNAPIPFGYAAFTVVNNTLYVLGGYDGKQESRKILTLKKQNGQYKWEIFGELPQTRLFGWAGTVDNSIYLLGGVVRFEPLDDIGTCCTSKTATNQLSVLDTENPDDGWKNLNPYPGSKRWLFSAESDGKNLWLFGGIDSSEEANNPARFNDALRYEIDENRWQKMSSLPESTMKATPLVPLYIDGKILFMSFSKTVWQLDLKTMIYSQLASLPEEAFVDRFVWLDNKIIGAGGENKIESRRRRSEWTFIGEYK